MVPHILFFTICAMNYHKSPSIDKTPEYILDQALTLTLTLETNSLIVFKKIQTNRPQFFPVSFENEIDVVSGLDSAL